jgi:hypothetical protein
VERDTPEWSDEGSLAAFKMYLLGLIMQLIVLCEYIYNQTATARSDCPDKFANLTDGIQRQLLQLNMKLAKDVREHWMGRHAKPNSKEIFKNNSFVYTRLRHQFHSRGPDVSLRKAACVVLQ